MTLLAAVAQQQVESNPVEAVVFDGSADYLDQPDGSTATASAVSDKKIFLFGSVDFTATAVGNMYLWGHRLAAGQLGMMRRDAAANLDGRWFDTSGTQIFGKVTTETYGAVGVNVLVSLDNNTSGKRTMLVSPKSSPTTAAVYDETGLSASNVTLAFAETRSGNNGRLTFASLGTGGLLGATAYRFAMWQGVAPDITSWTSTDFASFWNTSTGFPVNPTKSVTKLGAAALLDFYGNAAGWNAGSTGTPGNMTMIGAVV